MRLKMSLGMILLRLFCSIFLSALGLTTTVVEPLALPSCLDRLTVRRTCSVSLLLCAVSIS